MHTKKQDKKCLSTYDTILNEKQNKKETDDEVGSYKKI